MEINNEEREFLNQHYRVDLESEYFFQPFRTSAREGRWLSPKYPSSGSQSTRTKSDLAAAFIHPRGTKWWGWAKGYVKVLSGKLVRDNSGHLPVFWLAVWLYRELDFGSEPNPENLVARFLEEFHITGEERDELFRIALPEIEVPIWTDLPYKDAYLLRLVEPPPDARPNEGGTLRYLQIKGVGPVDIAFEPAERLSVITGDNGLGKTFLLDSAWWALTGTWSGRKLVPSPGLSLGSQGEMRFGISGTRANAPIRQIKFDWEKLEWPRPRTRPTIPGLIVYAKVDGAFAVWDPVRNLEEFGGQSEADFTISRDDVLHGDSLRRIEGMVRDWVNWQRDSNSAVFSQFKRVLRRLSPPDMNPLEPGDPVRIPGDPRLIPTLKHDYGVIPILQESAGVRRVVALAYLLVWAWNEHNVAASLRKKHTARKLVVLIDEIESHLHPKWQRVVLPALLDVIAYLSEDLAAQVIVASHSPLILASLEPVFTEVADKLFHLELQDGVISFRERKYIKYGTVDAWLTSEIFDLHQPRSRNAEGVVEQARLLMGSKSPEVEKIEGVTRELSNLLPEDDQFWIRWLYFAKAKGAKT